MNPGGGDNRDFPASTVFEDSFGPGSDKFEIGVIDTGQFADSPVDPITGLAVDGGSITGIAMDPTASSSFVYAVTSGGYVYSFNPSDTRSVDVDGNPANTYDGVINSINHGLVPPDPSDSTSVANGFVQFSSLTLGPRLTERTGTTGLGPYAQTLFGVTSQGWIYTMTIDGSTQRVVPAPVLYNGNSAIPIRNGSGNQTFVNAVGVAFSTREENLWHRTGDRGTLADNGHGIQQAPDQSRIRISGGSSLYFGNEIDGQVPNNTIEGGFGTLNPGGAQGTTVSRPFSLEGYNSGDKPTLYFNYLLEIESDSNYDPIPSPRRGQSDSFRVFASGDDGQWRLLATNNSYRSFSNAISSDEFDHFCHQWRHPHSRTL